MRLLDDVRHRWRWRRSLHLPAPFARRAPEPYRPGVPRTPVAVIALVLVATGAAGVWLGRATERAASKPPPTLELGAAVGAESARSVIAELSLVRTEGRHDLAAATTPSDQAAAAAALERGFRAASRELGSRAGIRAALGRAAQGYVALGQAASTGDARGFARASTRIAGAERDLERLIGARL